MYIVYFDYLIKIYLCTTEYAAAGGINAVVYHTTFEVVLRTVSLLSLQAT